MYLLSAAMNEVTYLRLLQPHVEEALDDTPVVLIHGPRQCGKTTLAQMVGEIKGYKYLTFDDPGLVATATDDPNGFIDRLPEKVILDEVQHVPELFSSIKRSVDQNRKPGRFLLTGSANVLLLPKLSDSLAGRMEILALRPLARCELEGGSNGVLSKLLNGDCDLHSEGKLNERLIDYILTGGFPEPLRRKTDRRRNQWYRNYIDTLVQRDIRDLARINNLDAMPKILQLVAAQSAQLLNMTHIAAPFQMTRQTIKSYFILLQHIFLVDVLPAWHANRRKRLIKTPKVHLTDTGLASALLGINRNRLETDRGMLGHLLESFIYNELRRQASWCDTAVQFYHFRDKDQYEVDIVIEQSDGGIVAVEVKAAATVTGKDFKGLKRLQSMVGDHFIAGVVFYDGDMILPFGAGMFAMPVSVLWEKSQ